MEYVTLRYPWELLAKNTLSPSDEHFDGRLPLELVTSADVSRLVMVDSGESLPVCGEVFSWRGHSCKRWALPSYSANETTLDVWPLRLLPFSGDQKNDPIVIQCIQSISRPSMLSQQDAKKRTSSYHINACLQWFLERWYLLSKPPKNLINGLVCSLSRVCRQTWADVGKCLWYDLNNDKAYAPYRLEAQLSDDKEFSAVLQKIIDQPSKLLKRLRERTPLTKANCLDSTCLQWLTRVPGRTALEKAGATQKILAVTRWHTPNVLENRVALWVVRRLAERCRCYIQEYDNLSESYYFKRVAEFKRRLDALVTSTQLRLVGDHQPPCMPNNVLRFERRYQVVWKVYKELLDVDKIETTAWRWQRVLWQEMSRQLVGTALLLPRPLFETFLGRNFPYYNRKIETGRFLGHMFAPGPFCLDDATIEVIDLAEGMSPDVINDALGALGAHQALLIRKARNESVSLYLIWHLWMPEITQEALALAAESCLEALAQHRNTSKGADHLKSVGGLLLVGPQDAHNPLSGFIQQQGNYTINVVPIDSRQPGALGKLRDILNTEIRRGINDEA